MALTEEDLSKIIEEGIDPENPGEYENLLKDLQGNILKSHGRDHAVHLFLKFIADAQDAKEWLQNFAECYVTSAAEQAKQTQMYKRSQKLGVKASITTATFVNLFLSHKGYEHLGDNLKLPEDVFFTYGMKCDDVKNYLGDVSYQEWDRGLQDEIHALILIADDDSERLKTLVEGLTSGLCSIAQVVQKETGFILRNESGQVIEHFGFADGVSQPLFMESDVDKAKNKGGFNEWDSRAPLNLVLAKDPNGKTEDSYGSYLVYRKLEQDVEAFRAAEAKLAEKLGINTELAGAYMMGRFKDGTPVTLSEKPDGNTTNNFNYDKDPEEFGYDPKPSKCPFHAHIRKTNPRGDTSRVHSAPDRETEFERERGHRIARRGISYGEQAPNQAPKTGSGLLFLCFQAKISDQFAFIQNAWSNENKFVKVNVGNDPIIGVNVDGEANPAFAGNRQWLKKWGETDSQAERDLLAPDDPFKIWIHLKGGEFFFAPSMSFLTNLAEDDS